MFNIHRTSQQDIANARAVLRASTEDMRAYCAYMDRNGDWANASDLYMRCAVLRWIDDMKATL